MKAPRQFDRAVMRITIAMVMILGACAGNGRNGENDTVVSPATPAEADGAAGPAEGPQPNAPSTIPPGSKSPEEIASQVERDLADYQQLAAAKRAASRGQPTSSGFNANGGTTFDGAPGPSTPQAPPANAIENGSLESSGPVSTRSAEQDPGRGAGPESSTPRVIVGTPEALSTAAAALYRDASQMNTPLRSLMALAALSIADPDRPFNPEALPDLTEDERQTLTRFHGFCRDLGKQLATNDDTESVSRAVELLALDMRGERRLRLPRGEFCTRVEGFGTIAAVEPREFVAHSGARFVLYFEVDGYRSVELGSEGWKTEMSVELSILSERDGVPVWRRDWQAITDLSSTRRQDFFVTHVVSIPDALSVGAYVMKIRLRDEQASALAELSIPFRMVTLVAPSLADSLPAPPNAPARR